MSTSSLQCAMTATDKSLQLHKSATDSDSTKPPKKAKKVLDEETYTEVYNNLYLFWILFS